MKRLPRQAWLQLLVAAACGLLVFAATALMPTAAAALRRLTYDWLLAHAAPPQRLDDRLVLVALDDYTFEQAGGLPDRGDHARMARALAGAGVRQLVWDNLFDQVTPADEELAAGMALAPSLLAVGVRLPTFAGEEGRPDRAGVLGRWRVGPPVRPEPWPVPEMLLQVAPHQRFVTAAAGGGHVAASVDGDGILRRLPLVVRVNDELLPALSLAAVMHLLNVPAEDLELRGHTLVVGGRTLEEPLRVPLDEHRAMLLWPVADYRDRLDLRSAAPLLGSLRDFPADIAADLRDRSMILGATYMGSGDFVATPTAAALPGVMVSVSAMNSLLTRQFLRPAPRWLEALLILLLPLLPALLFVWDRPVWASLTALLGFVALVLLAVVLFRFWGFFLPVPNIFLAILLAVILLAARALFSAHRRSLALTRVLGRFVSPALLREISAHGSGDALVRHVRRVEVTVLFADIAGFTAFADQSEAEDVSNFLGRFYRETMDVLFTEHGTLDKLLGDGILAYWGAPDALADKECRAAAAALALQQHFANLGEWLDEQGRPRLRLRVGLTTGYVTCGYLGDERHATYTVIGRCVNLASRLEGLAEPGQILADKRTARRLAGRCEVQPLPPVAVKGMSDPVEVYAVRAAIAPPPPDEETA